jgi:hypothetical protein
MHECERPADKAVAQSRKPSLLAGRQALNVSANRFDEHELRQLRKHRACARVRGSVFGEAEFE